jgi:hypothetical protein
VAPAPQPADPVHRKADVMRDFRKALAKPDHRGGGKRHKPAGGNPRFR